jgi:hypothetical protein
MAQKNTDDAGDTWTHVPRSKKRNRAPPAPAPGLPPPSRLLSIESITTEFSAKTKTWRQSACRKAWLQLFDRIRPDPGWPLHTAVCLGGGSLARDNVECRRRSMWQTVAFVDLARQLGGDLQLYVLDPAYTELDARFFASLRVAVLEPPPSPPLSPGEGRAGELGAAARRVLGPEAMLFEPFVDMSAAMLAAILECGVGVYVGSSIDGLRQRGVGDDGGELARRFCVGRRMCKVPSFEIDPNVFEGMAVYFKDDDDEEDDDDTG